MNLQQLKYILALERHRSFSKAAEELKITQPTLSAMLVKLEEELDVRIFERTNKTVTPTTIGAKIIQQMERAYTDVENINRFVQEEKGEVSGEMSIAVAPSIAPYIIPKFIRHYVAAFPQVSLHLDEMKSGEMLEALQLSRIDAGIAISGIKKRGCLEIPLYSERFYVYLAESCWRKLPVFKPENLDHERMWIMKEAQCLRESAFSFCKSQGKGRRVYEAGSVDTLIRIVDENGGFTIIPEMHLPFLTDRQRENVRRIEGDYLSWRRISLYIKDDYVREKMLNTITQTLIEFMPKGMLEERIVKFGVKLF